MAGFSYLKDNVKSEITKISQSVLKDIASKAPPLNYNDIFEDHKLSLNLIDNQDTRLVELSKEFNLENLDILRGVLFVQDRKIIVKDDGYDRRNNFVYGHEIGHWVLPWHKALLFQCTQFDLSSKARKQIEQEANFFAGELAFYGNEFIDYVQSGSVSLDHYKTLSDIFNMSKEATIRRSVEMELRPCFFMSLALNRNNPEKFLSIKYIVYSQSYIEKFAQLSRTQYFDSNSELAKIVTDAWSRAINEYKCEISIRDTETRLQTECWNNGYNILVLCKPMVKNVF